jgi:hypothetical protein
MELPPPLSSMAPPLAGSGMGREDVIEGAVLADEDDEVLDGSAGRLFLTGLQ